MRGQGLGAICLGTNLSDEQTGPKMSSNQPQKAPLLHTFSSYTFMCYV